MKTKTIDFYYRSIWLSISRMYAPLTAEYDLSVTAVLVLINIDKKRGTSATKIAPEIGLEARSITRVLKSLEEKKLITREKLISDKRHSIINLTQKGIGMRSIAVKYIKHFHKTIVDTLPKEDIETFMNVSNTINRLISNNKIYNAALKKSIETKIKGV